MTGKQPWPEHLWMLPTVANVDAALAVVWREIPDAVYVTDVRTGMPFVVAQRNGGQRLASFLPGFVWERDPQRTGAALVRALKR